MGSGVVEMTVIMPDLSKIDPAKIEAAVKKALEESAKKAQKELESTASTWRHRPSFVVVPVADGLVIGTDDEIYEFVDQGTRAHLIKPRRAKRLKFFTGGSPKTSPGVIGSRSGSPGSQGPIYAKGVRHPGTKARGFTEKISAKRQAELPALINAAILRVLP